MSIELRVSGNECFETNQEGKVVFSLEDHGAKFELDVQEQQAFREFYKVYLKYDNLSRKINKLIDEQ